MARWIGDGVVHASRKREFLSFTEFKEQEFNIHLNFTI
jgi:hypothetical protein